jgi:WD40 repeat protein
MASLIVFGLVGCQNIVTPSLAFSSPTSAGIMNTTQNIIPSVIPTESPTQTAIPSITPTPSFLPPSGEYIAYSNGKTIKLVSILGRESGKLMDGANEGRNWLSPNQEIVAYSDLGHIIQFRNIYTGEITFVKDQYSCGFGVTYLAWNPKGDEIAVSCGYGPTQDDIKIMTIPEGKIVGKIDKIIDTKQGGLNSPFLQTWSPDGKWIAYFIGTGDMNIGTKGPFLTDTSCLSNDLTCGGKTILGFDYAFAPTPISWTPDSNLALWDPSDYSVKIFKMPSFTLLQKINIPKNYGGIHSFIWSRNNDLFAFASMDGIYIMSSKTGNITKISQQLADLLFWIEIK